MLQGSAPVSEGRIRSLSRGLRLLWRVKNRKAAEEVLASLSVHWKTAPCAVYLPWGFGMD